MSSHFSTEYHHPHIEQPTAAHSRHQPHGTDLIGRPILFATGQFAGQAIRAELREIQQADLGRKYARVDRRPLDPPPVVQLRLFHVFNLGSEQETEKEVESYNEIQMLGLLCTVDLFPVPQAQYDLNQKGSRPEITHQSPFSSPGSSKFPVEDKEHVFAFAPARPYPPPPGSISSTVVPTSPHDQAAIPGIPPNSYSAPDIIHYIGNFPVTEASKMTHALVGSTFIQPSIVEYQGRMTTMFVFSDLAVKVEGTFILRYRFFDILAKPYNYTQVAVQAECFGGPFRVYSTKEFPGLQASTELTKQLARWGVRLNTRETERRRRKKGETSAGSPLFTGIGKRKLPGPDNPETIYESEDD
ncbi:velvet factor-domain-containing protein [Collybia nuda]|uniref:Velvet factor-domain-containing protein n=1 Tax=Collybia nuda TaxID=64659 RepID=A0A9P5Y5W4_9AGAR|nr:velvet factor-domain-containing protein [Collybia nuda]